MKSVRVKEFKIFRYSSYVKNMVGIQIELKNLEKGAKPRIVRF